MVVRPFGAITRAGPRSQRIEQQRIEQQRIEQQRKQTQINTQLRERQAREQARLNAQLKEAQEFEQARRLLFRFGGFPRFDPTSSVGKKIKQLQAGFLLPEKFNIQKIKEALARGESVTRKFETKIIDVKATIGKGFKAPVTGETITFSGAKPIKSPGIKTSGKLKDVITGATLLVDLPPKLTVLERLKFSQVGQFVKKTGKRFEEILPTIEDIEETKKLISPPTLEQRTFIPPKGFKEEVKTKEFVFGQGTPTKEILLREKTFFENLGVEENKASKVLEQDFKNIQNEFVTGAITEEEANEQIDNKLNSFVTSEAVRNIPKNVAISVGIGILSAVPIIGPIVGATLAGNLLLRRRQVLQRFKDFPKAASIETASFVVGGLVGNFIGSGARGKFTKPKITEDSLSSVVQIKGSQRTKLIAEISKVDPQFIILKNQKKITGLIAYKITLKDGRSFQILEFNKLTPRDLAKGLSGEKNFLGFEVGKAPKFAERVIGKAITVTEKGQAEVFLQAVRFKPINNKIVDVFSQQLGFNKGLSIEVLAKSKVIPLGKGRFEIISESRILSIKNTQKSLSLKIKQIQNKLDRGQRFSIMELKSLINLERRANGLKPFTQAEFNKAGFATVTKIDVQTILIDAVKTFNINANIIRRVSDVKLGLFGRGFTEPGKLQIGLKPAKITKTPLSKTFAAEIKAGKRARVTSIIEGTKQRFADIVSKNKARNQARIIQAQKPFSQRLQEAQAGDVGTTFGSPSAFAGTGAFELTSVGAIAKALAPKLPGVSFNVLTPIIFAFSSLSASEKLLISNTNAINNRVDINNRVELNLKNSLRNLQKIEVISEFSSKNVLKLKEDIRNAQKTGQKLRQLQKLKLRMDQKNISVNTLTATIPLNFIPIKPRTIIPKKAKPGVSKRKAIISIPKKFGYNVFAKPIKRKGKKQKPLRRINKVSLSRKKALDLGGWIVDNSLGRTFKIKKSGNPIKKPKLKVPANYFSKNRFKFRNFKIKKGQRIITPNSFIEKKTRLLDTIGERKKITLLKQRANLLRKFKKKQITKKKAFKNKSNFKKIKEKKLK